MNGHPPELSLAALANAQTLWDYLKLNQPLAACDCIIAMGSHDLRVAEQAAHLFLEGWAPLLVCSGGLGRLTSQKWHEAEARLFARIAIQAGVPAEKILIEDQSSNTGENIRFTQKMLAEQGVRIKSALLVQKPYMERRALATALKAWPEIDYCVSSPPIALQDYPADDISMQETIQIMAGDFHRILIYPRKGFQVEQQVPQKVMDAFQSLVKAGFSEYLVGD